jgi:hypothetical protein
MFVYFGSDEMFGSQAIIFAVLIVFIRIICRLSNAMHVRALRLCTMVCIITSGYTCDFILFFCQNYFKCRR